MLGWQPLRRTILHSNLSPPLTLTLVILICLSDLLFAQQLMEDMSKFILRFGFFLLPINYFTHINCLVGSLFAERCCSQICRRPTGCLVSWTRGCHGAGPNGKHEMSSTGMVWVNIICLWTMLRTPKQPWKVKVAEMQLSNENYKGDKKQLEKMVREGRIAEEKVVRAVDLLVSNQHPDVESLRNLWSVPNPHPCTRAYANVVRNFTPTQRREHERDLWNCAGRHHKCNAYCLRKCVWQV